jgi:protein-ribulosamine 3-kinase
LTATFEKTGPASALAMFEAEAEGLAELRAANEIRVPGVLRCGTSDGRSYLILERLALEPASGAVAHRLGEQLARLHRHRQTRFGWHRDNTIGQTPQMNDWSDDWVAFFREQRLGYQVALAVGKGYDLGRAGARLGERLPELFEGYEPEPSLLHGDLWAGNWGSVDGEPVIFDPAVHYGDRESDIAMTKLFGGFARDFYEAYESIWPLAPGHERRELLYQLYHVLNHLNLFGASYLARAKSLFDQLLRA